MEPRGYFAPGELLGSDNERLEITRGGWPRFRGFQVKTRGGLLSDLSEDRILS